MPQDKIGMKEDQPEQTIMWFQNRGLFSDHFLQARLPAWKEWKMEVRPEDAYCTTFVEVIKLA